MIILSFTPWWIVYFYFFIWFFFSSSFNHAIYLVAVGIGMTRTEKSKLDRKMPGPDPSSGSMQTSSPKVVMRSTTHHFCFAINLSSIRDLAIDFPVNCVLRWDINCTFHFWSCRFASIPFLEDNQVNRQKNNNLTIPPLNLLPQGWFCPFPHTTLSLSHDF